jgi:hypothetical protein
MCRLSLSLSQYNATLSAPNRYFHIIQHNRPDNLSNHPLPIFLPTHNLRTLCRTNEATFLNPIPLQTLPFSLLFRGHGNDIDKPIENFWVEDGLDWSVEALVGSTSSTHHVLKPFLLPRYRKTCGWYQRIGTRRGFRGGWGWSKWAS